MSKKTITWQAPEGVRIVPEIQACIDVANHLDVKTADSPASMREFLSGMFSYSPVWVRAMFGIRKYVAKVFGLPHEGLDKSYTPEEIPMEPGALVDFFTLVHGEEDANYLLEVDDKHLAAQLALLVQPLDNGMNRFHVGTLVRYKDWRGPVYFSLIKPFHHLIVRAMVKAGARGAHPQRPERNVADSAGAA